MNPRIYDSLNYYLQFYHKISPIKYGEPVYFGAWNYKSWESVLEQTGHIF